MLARILLCLPVLAVITITAFGCTGLTQGENKPGDNTYMEPSPPTPPSVEAPLGKGSTGSIAVDARSGNVFVAYSQYLSNGQKKKVLLASHADRNSFTQLADITGRSDTRLAFPKNGILMMSENSSSQDTLTLFDAQTYGVKKSVTKEARYHGTRLSPSGRYLAAADNNKASAPIHVVDTETLQNVVIPHDGDALEAMWLNNNDVLVAIVFYNTDILAMNTNTNTKAYARILAWSFAESSPIQIGLGFDSNKLWPNPLIDITVDGAQADLIFSYTWVGISPDDKLAVFPVVYAQDKTQGGGKHQLLVIDLDLGTLWKHGDARGPVGFSPDGSTIVSYRYGNDTIQADLDPKLLLIDKQSHEENEINLPQTGAPQYFVTREGNFVVVAPRFSSEKLVLVDLDQQKLSQVSGPSVDLDEFVSRIGSGELWMVDDGGLYRLDLFSAAMEDIALSFEPQRINILPSQDLLVLTDKENPGLVFVDPNTKSIKRRLTIPHL